MSEISNLYSQTTSEDTGNATSLQGSLFGVTRSDSPAGQTIEKCGQEAVPALPSRRQAKAKGLMMLVTSGLIGSDSSASAALQSSLENRLMMQLDSAGSTLFRHRWRRRTTPLGRRYLHRQALVVRTSEKGFTSVPTPNTLDTIDRTGLRPSRIATNRKSGYLTEIVPLASCPTPRANDAEKRGMVADDPRNGLVTTANLANVPTPQKHDVTTRGNTEADHHHYPHDLSNAAKLSTVATPRSEDSQCAGAHRGTADTLHSQTKLASVATPSKRDWKDSPGMSEPGVDPDGSIRSRLDQLPRQAQLAASGQTATGGTGETESIGQLDPAWKSVV